MQASIEQLVDFLKDDLMFVNVFVLTFKESDKRLTLGLQSMMKLLGTVLFYLDLLISYQSIFTMHCILQSLPSPWLENGWTQGECLAVSSGGTASSVVLSGATTPGGSR